MTAKTIDKVWLPTSSFIRDIQEVIYSMEEEISASLPETGTGLKGESYWKQRGQLGETEGGKNSFNIFLLNIHFYFAVMANRKEAICPHQLYKNFRIKMHY